MTDGIHRSHKLSFSMATAVALAGAGLAEELAIVSEEDDFN